MNENKNAQEAKPEHIGFLEEIEKEADEDLHPVLQKIVDNIKVIGIGVGAIILAAGGYSWFNWQQQEKMTQAQSKLGQILAISQASKKYSNLQDYLKQAPENLKTAVRLELAKESMAQEKFEQAFTYWTELSKSQDKLLQTIAILGQAKAMNSQKQPAKALQYLQQVEKSADKAFETTIINQIATTAELAQNWQVALSAYEKLKKDAPMANTGYIDYKINQIKQKTKG